MSETKIKIDLAQGIVEAEGSESFVRSIYDDFKHRIHAEPATSRKKNTVKKSAAKRKTDDTQKDPGAKPRKSKGGKSTPSLVKELDLTGGKDNQSLRDFYKQYTPSNNMENNLIFAYYLEHVIGDIDISVDHLFTCYRHISGLKVPKALQQSCIDTASRKGWLDTTTLSDIKVPVAGINHIEHDMKKAAE